MVNWDVEELEGMRNKIGKSDMLKCRMAVRDICAAKTTDFTSPL
jgi:hypothetical protein